MKLVCAKCKASIAPMLLVESLVASGGTSFKCACGSTRSGNDVRTILASILDQVTVADARKLVQDRSEHGSTCPCCDQFAKRYDRCMSSTIARWLIAFARASGGEKDSWVHVREPARIMGAESSAARSGDYAKARFWDLIEQKSHRTRTTNASGQWRLTKAGWDFVGLKSSVREKVAVYNNIAIEFSGKEIDIRTALGAEFNYESLMGAPTPSVPAA